MLSIKQWQTPCHGQTTRVYNQFAPFKCHGCTGHTRPTSASMVSCSRGDKVVHLCSNCWDEEDWICTDCHTKPDDSDVLGCEQCGQWAHIGCQLKSTRDKYTCNACLNTSVMPVVIPEMKVEIYDLTKSLKNTQIQLETKTAQLGEMADVHKTMTNDMKVLRMDMSDTKADIKQVHSHYIQQINTLKSTLTSEAKAQTQEMLHLKLTNARLTKEKDECRNANKLLKSNLQGNITKNTKLEKLVKATNKRARRMYENNRELELEVKKRRIRITWKTSCPNNFSQYKALWNTYKCSWRNLFGEMQYASSSGSYTSLNALLKDLQLAVAPPLPKPLPQLDYVAVVRPTAL